MPATRSDTPPTSVPTRHLVRFLATAAAPLILAWGSSRGGSFPTTSPVSNICGILTLADAQTVVATVDQFGVDSTVDTPDTWSRICHYSNSQSLGSITNLDLVIQGALTER